MQRAGDPGRPCPAQRASESRGYGWPHSRSRAARIGARPAAAHDHSMADNTPPAAISVRRLTKDYDGVHAVAGVGIGIVLQESQPDPGLTVREAVSLYAGYYDHPRPVPETLARVGLESRAPQL